MRVVPPLRPLRARPLAQLLPPTSRPAAGSRHHSSSGCSETRSLRGSVRMRCDSAPTGTRRQPGARPHSGERLELVSDDRSIEDDGYQSRRGSTEPGQRCGRVHESVLRARHRSSRARKRELEVAGGRERCVCAEQGDRPRDERRGHRGCAPDARSAAEEGHRGARGRSELDPASTARERCKRALRGRGRHGDRLGKRRRVLPRRVPFVPRRGDDEHALRRERARSRRGAVAASAPRRCSRSRPQRRGRPHSRSPRRCRC